MGKRTRETNIDLIRIIAFFFVVSIHCYFKNDFYEFPMKGLTMYVMSCLRALLRCCVTLFMMLTGYLMSSKKPSLGYFKGISKTLFIYVLASVVCMLFDFFYYRNPVSIAKILVGIFTFSGCSYAWYIGMYIGLFLLIPFLNILLCHLTRTQKKWLIGILFVITILPDTLNLVNFDIHGYWTDLENMTQYSLGISNFWTELYPVTFYVVGAYLKEYRPKVRAGVLFLFMIGVMMLSAGVQFWRCYGQPFVWLPWQGLTSLSTFLLSILFFVMLLQIREEGYPGPVRQVLKFISDLCLGAYLLSYIYDTLLYPSEYPLGNSLSEQGMFYIRHVPLVAVCSLASAAVVLGIYKIWRLCLGRRGSP